MRATEYAWQRVLACIVALVLAGAAGAQTCESPVAVSSTTHFSASTCDSTNSMPSIGSGTTSNNGPNVVYQVGAVGNLYQGTVTLQPASGIDLGLFLWYGKCSTYASCFEFVDNGPGNENSLPIPAGTSNFFIVVAHPASVLPTCGGYTLDITYPLND
jgi:hypothetical protein